MRTKNNVLITGASGFVGTSLLKAFHNEWNIVAATRNPDRLKTDLPGVNAQFIPNDVLTSEFFDKQNIDAIIHLAGIAHDLSGHFVDDDYFKVNFLGTKNLYEQFSKSKVKKFVFLSSIKALTDISSDLLTEDLAAQPKTAYGQSKRQAEEYILKNLSPDKQVFILRPCMIHGPGNKGNLNLLYKFVKSGIPYPLGAFDNQRSFLSIHNFNFMLHFLLQHDAPSGIYHLADDKPLATSEVVKIIAKAIGKQVRIWNVAPQIIKFFGRTGDVLHLPLNSHKLDKLTENMIVSNKKIMWLIGERLPLTSDAGLTETVKTFSVDA